MKRKGEPREVERRVQRVHKVRGKRSEREEIQNVIERGGER